MRLTPLAAATLVLGALASTATAQPVVVAGDAPARAAKESPSCAVVRASDADAEVACVFRRAAAPAAPQEGRVLVRAQFKPQTCSAPAAQVVDLPGAAPALARDLPRIEHAGRDCDS